MADTHDRKRCEIYYSGRVQGVGFRYTVRSIALHFEVTGFVKNLPDGRVQLVAEGLAEEIRRFLEAIAAEMGPYIGDTQRTSGPASGRFSDFGIRF